MAQLRRDTSAVETVCSISAHTKTHPPSPKTQDSKSPSFSRTHLFPHQAQLQIYNFVQEICVYMHVCIIKCLGLCMLCVSILMRTYSITYGPFSQVKCVEYFIFKKSQRQYTNKCLYNRFSRFIYILKCDSPPWSQTDLIMNFSAHKYYFL